MRCIRQAAFDDQQPIARLRTTEFGRSSEFSLRRPEKLAWGWCDDQNTVLAAWDVSVPVSTMRAVLIRDAREAAESIECTPPPDVVYPALIFNSAATRMSHRGLGLNQALRYHFLSAALRGPIQTIISPIYEGAPRIAFMTQLGYTFAMPARCWQSKLAPRRRRMVGLLHRSRMFHAQEHLMRHRGGIIRAYPYFGRNVKFYATRPQPDPAAAMFYL